MLKKNPEPNRVYILLELEKHAERENSFGGKFNDVDELRKSRLIDSTDSLTERDEFEQPRFIQDLSSGAFSEFKVINCFKVKEQNSENEKCKN